MAITASLAIALLLQVPAVASAQRAHSAHVTPAGPGHYAVPLPTDSSAVAVRAAAPPVIDGRDDDAIWRDTPPITAFREWNPTQGKAPRFRTEAKIA